MSEHKMVRFGHGYVQAQVLSENNSVKFKLAFAAGTDFSVPSNAYYTFQDTAIGTNIDGVGINVREFDLNSNSIKSFKSFALSKTEGAAANQAFIAYLGSLVKADNVVVILTSYGRLYSAASIDSEMKKYGSVMWPSAWLTSNYRTSYCALLSLKHKKIIAENASYCGSNNETRDVRPALEFIYDKPNDVGATGFSRRAIEDMETYIIDKDNPTKRYPSQLEQVSKISDYGINPGDIMQLSFEIKGDSSLTTPGQNIRVNLRWFEDSNYISGVAIESQPSEADKWGSYQRYVTVPTNATGFTIIVSRNPDVSGSEGTGAVREMLLNQVSRAVEPLMNPASFGVNGIRMNNMISDDVDENTLLILPNTEEDKSGDIRSADFREF